MKRSGLRSRLAALVTVCFTCVCLLSLSSGTAWAKVGSIKEFPIPTFTSNSIAITAGPDGNLWFTEFHANKIGRITTTGVVTEFPVPTPKRQLIGITAGPPHTASVWFTEFIANQIGEISTK